MEAYLNRQDAAMRLDNTICIWKGEPVVVSFDCDPGPGGDKVFIAFFDGSGRRGRTVRYTNEAFTYYPISLGYLNLHNNCFYMTRMPVRRQKQGLCRNNIFFTPNPPPVQYFPSVGLYETLMGIYPKSREVHKRMQANTLGVAVDRDVAFRQGDIGVYDILYREQRVGTYTVNEKQTHLLNTPATSVFLRILEEKRLGEWLT